VEPTQIMSPTRGNLGHRLRISGTLLILGLLTEIISLFWNHPLSFIAFAGIGVACTGLGILVFLWSLVSLPPSEAPVSRKGED